MLLDQLLQVIGYNNGQCHPCDQSIGGQHRRELSGKTWEDIFAFAELSFVHAHVVVFCVICRRVSIKCACAKCH